MTDETEVRLRDRLPAKPEGDPKETGARLAQEGRTEADAAGYGWYRPADLYALRLGAFEELLPGYLVEYGISAEDALEALDLLSGRALYDVETFKTEDPKGFAELLEVERRYWMARTVAQSLYVDGLGNVDPERPVSVDAPPDLVETVRAEARGVVEQGQGAGFAWLVNGPDCVQEEAAKYESLVAPYEVSPADAKAKAKDVLQGRPDPLAYLKRRGWGGGFLGGSPRISARQVLADIVRRQGGKVAEDVAISQGRILFPQAFRELLEPAPRMAKRKVANIKKGQLSPASVGVQLALELIIEDVASSRSQIADLTATELRAITGVYAVHSRISDDGWAWPASMRVDFRTFGEACALDVSTGKNRDDLLAALSTLRRKDFRTTVSFSDGGKRKVLFHEGPLLNVSLILDGSGEGSRDAEEVWRETGKWTGAAPVELYLELPSIHAYLASALVLDDRILHKIDRAAKEVRGKLDRLDILLLHTLFRTGIRQTSRQGPNGYPPSYLNRTQFLEDFHGKEKVETERKKGRYRFGERIEGPYLKSIEVLIQAGIIFPDWTQGYKSRNGDRDVFEVQPWVVKGSKEAEAIPRATKGRRRIPSTSRS